MVHNPGGDWNPGRGDNPKYKGFISSTIPGNFSDLMVNLSSRD